MIPLPSSLAIDYYERHLENKICRPILPPEFLEMPEKGTHTRLALLTNKLARFCVEKDGYAIAAPQVGIYIRMVVIVHQGVIVLINPNIVRLAGSDLFLEEACLSLPPNTAAAKVTRCSQVDVEYQDIRGDWKSATFKGLMARIVQHEIDHLDGCFFINRIGPVSRDIVMGKYRRHMKEHNGHATTA